MRCCNDEIDKCDKNGTDIDDRSSHEIYGGIIETTNEGTVPEGTWDEFNRGLGKNR